MLFADKLGMPKKIKDLAESLDLEVTNHHDPEFDAKLCALIFGELTDKYPSYQELIRKIDDQPKTNNNYFNQPSEDVLEENEEHLSNYQITQNELENIDLIGKGIVITGNFSIEREEIKTFLMKIGGQPYIRMMAGPVDYTPGAMRNATKADWRAMYSTPASMGTRCHQLAAYIVHDSPFTMLCDAPTNYLNEQECVDFITSLPVETDSTFIASGELGKYIVTVRKKDVNWYVGGMTNWDRRDVELDFSFLPEGVRYMATLFVDGINADKQAEDYRMEKRIVDRESRMKLHLASGGGFAMKLELCPLRGRVTAVPEGKGIPSFYKKYIETEGLYVTSSERVSDEALLKACDIISLMLAKRPDVKAHMVKRGCHVMVIGKDEETCDLPEFAHICNCEDSIKYWNWRARGFGGAPEDELSSSCGEENLLALPQDKYVGENILIHEFAHLIHTVGIVGVEPGFNDRLEALRQNAIRKGLWKDTYAVSNKEEYFAECVQSFFNCNRYADPANGVHNWVNRRAKLKSYDPDMYRLLQEYFYEIEIPVNNIVHK